MERDRDKTANRCLILIALLSVAVTIGIVCLMAVPAMAQEEQWNKTFGGRGDDYGYSVQQTSDGGYIIAGYTYSYGAGDSDIWLIKTDSNGTEEWNRTFGGAEADLLDRGSVRQTSDGGYIITGYTYSYGTGDADVWLIKIDSDGIETWNRTFGKEWVDWGHSVQQTADGGYIIAGRTDPHAGARADAWLIKTDSTGIEEWNRTFGTDACEYAASVHQTTDGGYIVAGRTSSYGVGVVDAWLIKTDSDGIEEWNRTFGGLYYDYGYSVQQTLDGGYILAGCTNNRQDIWLIKTDTDGMEEWNSVFGGPAMDEGYSVQQTADDGYIIAGYTESYGAGSSDIWLIKTDSNGTEQWNKAFGGAGRDTARSVQQTADSGYIVAGLTNSYGAGGYDVWLIKSSTSAPKPDIITTIITPLSFFPNQPNTITGTLANTGSADAGSFNVSLSVDGAVVDSSGVASLCTGSTVDVCFTWTATVGDHELCVFADCDFAINESKEDNNELCEDVTVHVNTVYFTPISSRAVEVRVNTTDTIDHVLTGISFDPACINITEVDFGSDFTLADWMHKGDHITIDGFDFGPPCTQWSDRLLANLTVHCKDCCISQLSFTGLENVTKLIECGGKASYGANWIDGSVSCALEDITPPASITHLTNVTGNFWINWTWTDPVDPDFAHVMVYLDGTFVENVTTGTQFYNATWLTADTAYEIGTHTVDTSGNINSTWVNDSATTAPAYVTVPASVTNLQNTTFAQTYINWTWTDPVDPDFAHVMVYLDGAFMENVMTGMQFYNAIWLTANTSYEIGTHTVGSYGIINSTWVNDTATTAPPPAVTAPASVTNLQNTTYAQTYINWTWTDPVDSNFAKVMVYLDGTFKENVMKGTQLYNATGLTNDTEYTIGTHTVNEVGSINLTWVNDTARTAPGVDVIPPASVTSLTNTTYAQTYINWTWTNPQDLDFNYTMVYLNGTWQTNTSYPFYTATDLVPDTYYEIGTHTVDKVGNVNKTWVNQTAKTQAEISEKLVFDTGEGTYPSIFGTHEGKIIPDKDIMVSKMYTYPCKGTGGHTEYVAFYYQNGTEIGNASWKGYKGDWHNISFDAPFTLEADETYNYTIKTGSYPQIIHKQKLETEEGKITCSQFEDTNGKIYRDWIPAIKLIGVIISPDTWEDTWET